MDQEKKRKKITYLIIHLIEIFTVCTLIHDLLLDIYKMSTHLVTFLQQVYGGLF